MVQTLEPLVNALKQVVLQQGVIYDFQETVQVCMQKNS
ncbi:hypothetical protein J533_3103 [Acinetobacter baumannii 4749]|nr:hypothetical protein J533_3103 [Acinetobacter baumannii 4749]